MSLTIRPLSKSFGAEVLQCDVSQPLGSPEKRAILDALYEYLVLVFRKQTLGLAAQVAFTECIGELEVAWDSSNTNPDDVRVQVVSNAGRSNVTYRTSSQYWHTDRSFVEAPSMATILHMIKRPPYGGNTLYADMRSAYAVLSEELRVRIEKLFACHSFAYRFLDIRSRRISRQQAEQEVSRYPDVLHPLVRTHPITKRKALYMSELCVKEIAGVGNTESSQLLKELYNHSLQPRFIYEHKWQDGDLLVWDNPSLMHKVSDLPSDYPRVLHRTTTLGSRPY